MLLIYSPLQYWYLSHCGFGVWVWGFFSHWLQYEQS